MNNTDKILRASAVLVSFVTIVFSIYAFITAPITTWAMNSLILFLLFLALSIGVTLRYPNQLFAYLVALFSTLVIGRLFGTMRFVQEGSAELSSMDPLMVAETGPGIPHLMYLCTVLALIIVLQIFRFAYRQSTNNVGQLNQYMGQPSVNDWALTFIRFYVGLMMIGHFVGHIFSGPIPFGVFTTYFMSLNLPYPNQMVVLAGLIELAVAIGLTFGFMTRIAALGGAIYLFVAVGLGGHYTAGYIWVLPGDGWEFPALWISIISVFIFSGGGKISVDAWLKKATELNCNPLVKKE
ncbi:MAG: DoxX family protein [Ostreibacterium sp.]